MDYGVPRNYGANPTARFTSCRRTPRQVELQFPAGSLRITGWHGFTSIANYVWSKSLDNSSDGEDFEPNAAQPNDSTRPYLEYGPSNFNLPQRFTWLFGYKVPTAVAACSA